MQTENIGNILAIVLMITMVLLVINDIVYQRKVRKQYVVRRRNENLEDTLRDLGFAIRKDDR